MKRTFVSNLYVVVFGCALLATGCASTYYKVTDPASGKVFYTEEVKAESSGAVKLKDARSKAVVTLQNSEVIEISEDQYKAGLAAPVSAPAVAPAAVPAAVPAAATTPAPAAAPSPAPEATPAATPTPTTEATPAATPEPK
jgi:hypothetical protein